ncbi:MAG: MBL fold metallo-hydrolase [Promethearchaeota archaeon]
MINNNQHFEIIKHKDYLYVIRESISAVHPVYKNSPLNLFLILGTHTALLLDTGCGLYPLKPIVDELIGKRKLLVFNTHCHWDHVLGNEEFGEVYIHENEVALISKPYDVSHLKDSPCEIVKRYASKNFSIPPARVIKKLKDKDIFDLGEISIEIVHTPGHSPGSICLLSSKGELFTSDVAYYGEHFLPRKKIIPKNVLPSISKLIKLCEENSSLEIYPSHKQYPCDKSLLIDLYNGIKNIDNLWYTRKEFDFFFSWVIDDDKFRYYVSRR